MEPTRIRPALAAVGGSDETPRRVRALPHNLDAEQALLGALLVNNDVFNRVGDFLDAEDFFEPVHARIFGAAKRLHDRGMIASPISLKATFDADEGLQAIGGSDYLFRLADSTVTIINAPDYARLVHDLAVRRRLAGIGEEIVNVAFDAEGELSADEQIERAEHSLFTLAETGRATGGFQPFAKALTAAVLLAEAAHKREGRTSGVATGLLDLDNLVGGLHRSDLIILAGRPSMGKTALATSIAFNAARARANAPADAEEGAVVGFFSLEMSSEQLALRMLSEESGVPSERLRLGRMSQDEFNRVVFASQTLEAVPFFIDDTPALSVGALRARARRLKRQHGLGFVVVDYLQLLRSDTRRGAENRVLEISEITQGLKALAKELNVPVLALSQLSRAVESREDKRPLLSDLRESGAIEQDADVVMMVFREEYYVQREDPRQKADESDADHRERYDKWQRHYDKVKGIADLLIAKHRHGPIGQIQLWFDAETTKFGNLDRTYGGDDGR
ncbi:MAG: replicative DNA helicase [Alphaproteobacteria bacterium]|nr:replicative DNA helicase [Alphaproteobacteria bacterium]